MTAKLIGMSFLTLILMFAAGCEQEGPAERAGEKLDEAVSEGQSKMEDAVERAGDQIEEAGDKIEEKTE